MHLSGGMWTTIWSTKSILRNHQVTPHSSALPSPWVLPPSTSHWDRGSMSTSRNRATLSRGNYCLHACRGIHSKQSGISKSERNVLATPFSEHGKRGCDRGECKWQDSKLNSTVLAQVKAKAREQRSRAFLSRPCLQGRATSALPLNPFYFFQNFAHFLL